MLTCLCNPQLIAPATFNLDTIDGRRALLKDLKKKNLHMLYGMFLRSKGEESRYILYITGSNNNNNGYIFLHNETDDDICYIVRFQPDITKALKSLVGRTVTQTAVWRNEEDPGPSGSITKDVFFDKLLPKVGALASDTQQTELGRRFWVRRITDAWSLNLHVYFADTAKRTVIELNRTLFAKLRDEGTLWGTEPVFKQRFLVISAQEIPERRSAT